MSTFLFCLAICIISVKALDIKKYFKQDNFDTSPLPTKTDKYTSSVSTTGIPYQRLSILDLLTIEIERKKNERRKKRRRKIESWFGKRSFFAMRSGNPNGIRCSSCSSNSLSECTKTATIKQCTINQRCYTINLAHRDSSQVSIIKGCTDASKCHQDSCKRIMSTSNGYYRDCAIKCCQDGLCNKVVEPKQLPMTPVPPGQKCYICQSHDEASCDANRRETQCESSRQCASVYVIQASDGNKIFAKGCVEKSICGNVCNKLNSTSGGAYGYCNGSCCDGGFCNGDVRPTNVTPTKAPAQVKCATCIGRNQTECDAASTVTQCVTGERCYTSYARLKDTTITSFSRGCTRYDDDKCATYCNKMKERLVDCVFTCCDGNLCNKLVTPTVHNHGLWCTHCASKLSEDDCESTGERKKCVGNNVCYFGRASYGSGEKMFAKGCMKPEECPTACKRLGGAKYCNVTCCQENNCNKPSPTKGPVKNPNIRALLKLIEAFRVLLLAIENSIRVSAVDFKSSDFRDQLSSLIEEVKSQHQQNDSIENLRVRNARRELRELRRRARETLKSL